MRAEFWPVVQHYILVLALRRKSWGTYSWFKMQLRHFYLVPEKGAVSSLQWPSLAISEVRG